MATTLGSKPPQAPTSRLKRPPRRFPSDTGHGSSREDSAAKISRNIDEEIRKESARKKDARNREVKVLLLGQAESGKSTFRKQFQLYYASRSIDVERLAWIPVVYSNIIRAVRMIFIELEYETSLKIPEEPLSLPGICQEISSLRMKLLPLIALESILASELSGGVTIADGTRGAFVRQGWQALNAPTLSNLESKKAKVSNRAHEATTMVARTLDAVVDHIDALWAHDAVKFYVLHRKIRLDESASYFLRHIQRIAEPEYSPTNDDILHARLQTLGIIHHSFRIAAAKRTYDWKLYDVGGARGQRHAWIPYFDDATAIIFLAPISAFDQYLEEDPEINRIRDSLQLFSGICSNRLLKDAKLVLLLNKTDILREKLKAGVMVQKYITSFGERSNDFETVSDYFRSQFQQVHSRKDISNRPLYLHFTSMLDIKATQSVIPSVAEAILRKHIAQAGLT